MTYCLYYDLPYEPYFAIVGSLEEVKEWLREVKHVSPDELTLYTYADIDIYELAEEARK